MNEVRLIDANALKKAFNKWWGCDDIPATVVEDIIDNAPTVSFMISPDYVTELQNRNKELIKQLEEVERPQGEWIDYDNTFYKCPDCGYLLEKCCPQCQNEVILPKGEFTDLERKVIADSINYLLGAELLEENGYTEEVVNALKSVLQKIGAKENHL